MSFLNQVISRLSNDEDDDSENNMSINNGSFQESVRTKKTSGKNPKLRSSKLLQKALDTSHKGILKLKYCALNCQPDVTLDTIRNCRYRFWSKPIEQRVEWFLDKVCEGKMVSGKMMFHIDDGKTVCGTCFRHLYKMSKNFYYLYLKQGRTGTVSAGMIKGRGTGKSRTNAISWLEEYSGDRADRMPVKEELMLPCGSKKIDIYKQYSEEKTEKMEYSLSKSTFYKLWEDEFPHLKIKQVYIIQNFVATEINICFH